MNCLRCHAEDPPNMRRGLCSPCYEHLRYRGELDEFARRNRTAAETVAECRHLQGQGMGLDAIAKRMGITIRHLQEVMSDAKDSQHVATVTTLPPRATERSGDWRDSALCREFDPDPEIWFVVTKGRPAMNQTSAAKAICEGCPVKNECLEWALSRPSEAEFGIWGGLDEQERKSLIRRRNRRAYKANGGGK